MPAPLGDCKHQFLVAEKQNINSNFKGIKGINKVILMLKIMLLIYYTLHLRPNAALHCYSGEQGLYCQSQTERSPSGERLQRPQTSAAQNENL